MAQAGNNLPGSHKRVVGREHSIQAWRLQLGGASERDIAKTLGMSPAGVHKALKRAYELVTIKPAEDLKKLYDSRYEALIMANWTRMRQGDYRAGLLVLQALESLRALHGVDAPKRITVDLEPEIRRLGELAGLSDEEVTEAILEAEGIVKAAGMGAGK